jgi:alkylhydroperoxidase family enzyme
MGWTAWIRTESGDTEETKKPIKKKISDLTRLTSLTPEASHRIDELCAAVYKNASGLTVREKEIAALVTSSLNGCVH